MREASKGSELDDVLVAPPNGDPRPLAATAFDSLRALPAGWRYGDGLEWTDEWDGPTSPGGDVDPDPLPPLVERLGEPRHPAAFVGEGGAGVIRLDAPRLACHDCLESDGFRWVVAGEVDDVPGDILDADQDDDTVPLGIFGTRKGDTATLDATVSQFRPTDDGRIRLILAVELESDTDEHGTLYRWWATGCLVCRDDGGDSRGD